MVYFNINLLFQNKFISFLDGILICNGTGMTLKINYTKFNSHGRPFKIHFKEADHSSCHVAHNSTDNLVNDQLFIHSSYNSCGIQVFQRGFDIVYNQTILLTYGKNPKSDLVYREEVITFDVGCTKINNLTVNLDQLGHVNVSSLTPQTFVKSKALLPFYFNIRL